VSGHLTNCCILLDLSMRILFLLTQDIESPSGMGRYFPLARELARLGHKTTIAALHADFDSLKQTRFDQDGVDIWYVAPMHVLKQGAQKSYYKPSRLLALAARATLALTHAALNTPTDIIHIGKPHPMNSLAGLIAKNIRGKCTLLDCDDYETTSNRYSASWQQRGVAFFENFTPRHVHHITTHNSFLRSRLLGLGIPETKITYIPNGVDFARFTPPAPDHVEALRASLNLVGKKVVAFVGTISMPSHPVDLLLDAFAQVHQAQPDSVLLIVGGGDEYDRLVEKARQMGLSAFVHFCGRIAPAEVPAYYRLANVVVDPVNDDDTARGRLPLKLFESWISEVPFVTGDAGDRRLVLGSPPAGMLALPGDPNSLAECILHILQNPEEASTLQQRGIERARLYSWDTLAQQAASLYQQILSEVKPHA
jgi:glycosyltransferase involved in cell wall biosynthesis